jgi:hypothetical protein
MIRPVNAPFSRAVIGTISFMMMPGNMIETHAHKGDFSNLVTVQAWQLY